MRSNQYDSQFSERNGASQHFERLADLKQYTEVKLFPSASCLRVLGRHYSDMYLLISGRLSVVFDPGTGDTDILQEVGPVGEFGFLYGMPATSTVTSESEVEMLVLDDAILISIEQQDPELAVAFMQYLARFAANRSDIGIVDFKGRVNNKDRHAIATLVCRDEAMLAEAQRLRYAVYCTELGRSSPHADHEKKIIADPLDEQGFTFLAKKNGELIGTMRTNSGTDKNIVMLANLYNMTASPHYPERCIVCTKLVVTKSARGGNAAVSLIAGVTEFALENKFRECYIDCIPSLLHYYQAMGFRVAGKEFFHRENGRSIPMRIDLNKHGPSLCAGSSMINMAKLYVKAKYFKLHRKIVFHVVSK